MIKNTLKNAVNNDTHNSVDIAIDCPAWRQIIRIQSLCRQAVRAALATGPITRPGPVSILLTDDRRIAALNQRFRGQAHPTNVLSFPLADDGKSSHRDGLGDVVLAWETVCTQAAAQGKPPQDHLRHLLVHGILHLLGHDHNREDEAERMETLERRILRSLGVPDPYGDAQKYPS